MPSEEDISNQKRRLDVNRRNLQLYLAQLDYFGLAYATPAIINGIQDSRNAILRIKTILRNWRVNIEDMPDDEENGQLVEEFNKKQHINQWKSTVLVYGENLDHGQIVQKPLENADKDGDMNYIWPINYDLRLWQREFLDKYITEDKKDFLLVATPGAGKTIASLRVANYLLNTGAVKQIVVVCPTDHLRNQWLHDATKVNIHLDKLQVGWSNDIAVTTDFIGIVTTYQQVVTKQRQIRAYNLRAKTLVILDEIHHCGDEDKLTWGPAIKNAFEASYRRLLLSGTPFRTDNNRIPFAEYTIDSQNSSIKTCVADYSYSYGDALKDDFVVRHIVFPGWDGKFIWEDFFGDEKEASFETILNKEDSSSRLKTAIHHQGQAIRKVIQLADSKLNYIRMEEGCSNAGGLVIAQDQTAAYELAKILKAISGENPVIAVYDDENASKNIDVFRSGLNKWIVAVKMVSEGVDIKRLRVGVYATNIVTRTFFRQVIGRVIRWDSAWNDRLDDQTAWFYVPEDPRLITLMKEIKDEIVDVIIEQERKDFIERSDGNNSGITNQMTLSNYQFKYSEGEEKNHYFNGHSFPLDELQEAERFFAETSPGFERIASAPKALFIRNLNARYARNSEELSSLKKAQNGDSTFISRRDQNSELRSKIKRKIATLVRICQQKGVDIPGNAYQLINNAWGRNKSYSHMSTNEQLEQKIVWVEGLIQMVIQGNIDILKVINNE